ncbi:hypothetical protein [Candidatus Methanocrinis natronophilus]|uniref:Thioredoxin family protein n=1 Tax=Candidatus Methanocrinis natronophilus TaxID=3033396 RepID=A0ABT5X5M9_9EURY|nr:hypothetical protein [Candidatus Methanocrinis natronophilus]MDF0589989.1 hypothetical protein [Candidatus Methanocrinis natronophilus]
MGADRTLSPKGCKRLAHLRYAVVVGVAFLFLATAAAGGNGGAGAGPEGWWIYYPDHHSRAGYIVDHPIWALGPLEEKPVIIFIHRIGCSSCIWQEAGIHKALGDLGDEVAYVDILADNQHQKAWEVLVLYDPTGNPRLVPLTVYLTLVPGPEGSQVAWRSAVGHQGDGLIRSILDDAILLHARGSGGPDP